MKWPAQFTVWKWANSDRPAGLLVFHQRKCLKGEHIICLEVLIFNLILLWVFVYDDHDTCFVCLLAEKAINKICFLYTFSTEIWRSWIMAEIGNFLLLFLSDFSSFSETFTLVSIYNTKSGAIFVSSIYQFYIYFWYFLVHPWDLIALILLYWFVDWLVTLTPEWTRTF